LRGTASLRRQGVPQTESAYWRYETFLKFLESRLNMMVGANGGIFAIRRELVRPLPDGAIIDDFLISMRIRAGGTASFTTRKLRRRGDLLDCAGVPPPCAYRRRQPGRLEVHLAAPESHGWLGFAGLLVAQDCRWLVPFAVLGEFVAAMALARERLYAAIAVANAVLFLMAWTGYAWSAAACIRGS